MRKLKKKWLSRALACALAVALTAGTAVMTPIADIVGTNITAHASENIIAQGSYWKLTDDDEDGNYKLTFFGTIPDSGEIYAEAEAIYFASASAASPAELIQASWLFATDYVTEVTIEEGTKTSADASYLFSDFWDVTSMDLSNLDTSDATDMEGMFYYCSSLTSLNLSGWDTSKVEYMSSVFEECEELTSLNLSGWDTSKVTDMYSMFYNCENLKTIIVGNGWNTDKVISDEYMFDSCASLVGGQGTKFADAQVTDKTYARIDGGPASATPGYFTKGHAPLTYTVTWKNYDGTTLETDENVEKGTMPEYNGEMPTKVPDENGKPYYFVGWKADDGTFYDITKKLPAVSENVTYTAVFKQAVEFEQGNTYHKGDIIGVSKSTYWFGANGKDGRNAGGRWYHNHAFLITNVSYTPDWSPNVYRFGPAYVFDIKDLINGGTDTIIVYAYKVHDNAEDAGLTVFGYYESPETHTMFNKFSEYLGDIDESFITFVNSTDSTPEIVLTYPVTGEILTQGTDYKVECNNENTAAVIGIGRFSGELQVNCVVLPREMKASITNRRKAGNNAKATLSGEWYLPKNATNIKAGIARLSTDDTNITKYDVYNNGVKKASTLKTTSGKYSFSLLMNSTHANQNLYAVTYVTYEIDGKEFISLSNVFTSSYANLVA